MIFNFIAAAIIAAGIFFIIYKFYISQRKTPAYAGSLLDLSPLPQALVNTSGDVVHTNAAFRKMFPDGTPQNIRQIGDSFNSQERQRFQNFYRKAFTDKPVSAEFSEDPDDAWVRLRIEPIFGHTNLYGLTYEQRTLSKDRRTPAEREVVEILFDVAPTGIAIMDLQGNLKTWNDSFQNMVAQEFHRNQNIASLFNDEDAGFIQGILQGLSQESIKKKELDVCFLGKEASVTGYMQKVSAQCLSIHLFDQSEQKNLQLRLLQSQKLHAMGQLAGGIAHDFNNLLTAMSGFCDLLLSRHSPGDQSFTDIMQIKQNTSRAANLVRQLLAFSRQQTLQPKVIDLTETLSELMALLQRLIGPSNVLKVIHGTGLNLVKIDQGQFEQVIINLVVNARDAMPKGGTITIKTQNKILHRQGHYGSEIIPQGYYVVVEVVDTGTGIKEEHIPRIFDPFFSTKESGAGTGLGLSTVYGIVKQMEGYIVLETAENKGTTFRIFLPRFIPTKAVNIQRKEEAVELNMDLTGRGRILIAEDESAVRIFATRTLRDKGYDVVEAHDGREAIGIYRNAIENQKPFDLVITDVVMPNLDGPNLAKQIQELNPSANIIFISGYAETNFRDQLSSDESIHFLSKPFSLKDLASKVKEVLLKADHRNSINNKVIANYREDGSKSATSHS